MLPDLPNRRVFRVGASGSIGAATARAFAHAGAQVTAAERTSDRLDAVGADAGDSVALVDLLDNGAIEASSLPHSIATGTP